MVYCLHIPNIWKANHRQPRYFFPFSFHLTWWTSCLWIMSWLLNEVEGISNLLSVFSPSHSRLLFPISSANSVLSFQIIFFLMLMRRNEEEKKGDMKESFYFQVSEVAKVIISCNWISGGSRRVSNICTGRCIPGIPGFRFKHISPRNFESSVPPGWIPVLVRVTLSKLPNFPETQFQGL